MRFRRSFRTISRELLALTALVCLLSQPAFAAESVLKLSDAQRHAAGITLEGVRALSAEDLQTNESGAGTQLSGQVVLPNARQDVLLANVAGRLEAVLVNPGDQVKAGQVVARLYSAELLGRQRAYLAARSQSELALARVKRDESLLADGVIAQSRVQAVRADAAQARAILLEQRQLLRLAGMSEAAINGLGTPEGMSPILPIVARRAGLVLQQSARVGEQVDNGAPLMTIAALEVLWIDLQATRDQAAGLSIGDRVALAGCAIVGRLIATGVQLDASSQTLSVRAQFDGAASCVAPNQFVQVTVSPTRAAAGLVSVPIGSVVHRAGKDYVFVQQPGGFLPVEVTVERRHGSHAWLRRGPATGAQVAAQGVAALKGSWLGLGAGGDGAK